MFTRPTTLNYHFSRFDPLVRPQGLYMYRTCSCKNFRLITLTGNCTVQNREQLETLLTGTIALGHTSDTFWSFVVSKIEPRRHSRHTKGGRHICTIGKRVDGRRLAEPTTARYQLVSFLYLLLACLLDSIHSFRFRRDSTENKNRPPAKPKKHRCKRKTPPPVVAVSSGEPTRTLAGRTNQQGRHCQSQRHHITEHILKSCALLAHQ